MIALLFTFVTTAMYADYPLTEFNGYQEDSFGRWFVKGEVLCWQAQEDRLNFVSYQPLLPSIQPVRGNSLGFDWKLGFRLGFGYYEPCEDIYTSCCWTSYKNEVSRHVPTDGTTFARISALFPDFTNVDVSFFDSQANWKLNYNVIDWEVGSPGCISRLFVITPFFGLRAAVIDQNYGNQLDFILISSQQREETFFRQARNDYQAAGIRAGLNLQSYLWCGFSTFVKVAGSLLYGTFDVADDIVEINKDIATGNIVSIQSLDFVRRDNRLRPNLEVALGIQWTAGLFDNTKHITFKVGYEFIAWYKQNQFRRCLVPNRTRTDALEIQGLQWTARLDF